MRLLQYEKLGRIWGLTSIISQPGYLVTYAIVGILADALFLPLLMPGGTLASSIGKIIGVGDGRGIGLMFVISGVFVIASSKSIKALEIKLNTKETITSS